MNILKDWEAKWVVNGVGRTLFENTKGKIHTPVFPKDRKDMCVVKYEAVDGRGMSQAIFLVWKNTKDEVCYLRVDDISEELLSNIEQDFVGISDVNANNSGTISIKISSGGTLSGKGNWNKTIEIPMDRINRLEC